MIERVPIRSEMIRSAGWKEIDGKGVLEIQFKNEWVYRYSGVPEYHFDAILLLSATGSGVTNYFNTYIKGTYPYERVYKTSDPESITPQPIEIQDDPYRRVLTVKGIRFAYDLFEVLANPDPTRTYQFRKYGDTVTITDVTP